LPADRREFEKYCFYIGRAHGRQLFKAGTKYDYNGGLKNPILYLIRGIKVGYE